MKKKKAIYASIISLIMAVSLVLGVVTNPAFKVQAESSDSYVELYSPDKVNEGILYQNPKYLSGEVVDHNDTESGKAIALDYKAGHSG